MICIDLTVRRDKEPTVIRFVPDGEIHLLNIDHLEFTYPKEYKHFVLKFNGKEWGW